VVPGRVRADTKLLRDLIIRPIVSNQTRHTRLLPRETKAPPHVVIGGQLRFRFIDKNQDNRGRSVWCIGEPVTFQTVPAVVAYHLANGRSAGETGHIPNDRSGREYEYIIFIADRFGARFQ
jgi:hypothetical protein